MYYDGDAGATQKVSGYSWTGRQVYIPVDKELHQLVSVGTYRGPVLGSVILEEEAVVSTLCTQCPQLSLGPAIPMGLRRRGS